MPIKRLNHAVLYVRDVEASVRFYGDVLDATLLISRTSLGNEELCKRRHLLPYLFR